MDIVVFIKQVPSTPSIRIDRERMSVIREGVESIINPLDRLALGAALDLCGKSGGRITVITMGPPQSEEALREALAAGADRAILLSDSRFAGSDTYSTSHVLARSISMLEDKPDLIICGMQTIDSDTGHIGPQIAEELDLPQVCGVNEIHIEQSGSLLVKRLSDGFLETIRLDPPVLITVGRGVSALGDIPLADIQEAFEMGSLEKWGAEELGLSGDEVGLKGSPTKVRALRMPDAAKKGELVHGSPARLLDEVMRRLEELGIVEEGPHE